MKRSETARNVGRLETLDGQRRWTVRDVGRPETLDGQRRWTARDVGRPETLDGQRRWTARDVGRPETLDGVKRLQNHTHIHASKTKETLYTFRIKYAKYAKTRPFHQ
jgi:hypothetical protein